MKLIYCSSITIPSSLSNRYQTLNMAKAFIKHLGSDFYFGLSDIGDGSEHHLKYIENLASGQLLNVGINKSYFLALKYIKFIRKNNIKNIYCREPRLLLFLIFFSKLFFYRAKFIYEVHIIPETLTDKIIHRIVFFFTRYFIFITKNLREFYIKNYKSPENRTMVAADSVDLEMFDLDLTIEQAREKLGLAQDKKIIGYFGRFKTLNVEKGLTTILKSLKLLPENIIFLAMGGKGINIRYYRALAEKMGLANRAFFIKPCPQYQVAQNQKACNILVMPFPNNKHFALYMSPAKMFEHMAGKRPILASDLPSIREILNESSCFFIEPGNPEDMAQTINKILENPELSAQKSEKAFKDVNKHTWQERVKNILNFISGGDIFE